MENAAQAVSGDDPNLKRLVAVLEDMTQDWDLELSGPIGRDVHLIGDLAFESIDIVEFVVAVEQEFGQRSIPFDKLLMVDGRYVDDLTVGQVADFIGRYV